MDLCNPINYCMQGNMFSTSLKITQDVAFLTLLAQHSPPQSLNDISLLHT